MVRKQKWAGCLTKYIISVIIHFEISLCEFRGFDFQMLGNALYVFFMNDGAYAFTAIGTIEAIDCFKGFIM